MKKKSVGRRIAAAAAGVLLLAAAAGCGQKAPEAVHLGAEGYILRQEGDTCDLADFVTIDGDDVSQELTWSVTDEAVASVSEEGVLTANGEGSAKVTAASAADENVKASADILVYDYTGVYSCQKYIDAMGCDIRVSLKLNEDGSFVFYRYPMVVNLEGGGRMEGMYDNGTYTVSGNQMTFTAEYLGEFTLDFMLNADGNAELSGDTPTGGAPTAMTFTQESLTDQSEEGTYTGSGERESGEVVSYTLTLSDGTYTLLAESNGTQQTVSAGIYRSDAEGTIEFFAENAGITFRASYDAQRGVIEGTEIPVDPESSYEEIAVTLTR